MTDRFRRVIHKADPIQRPGTAPPQQMAERRPLWQQSAEDWGTQENKNSERPRAVSPPPVKTVKVPLFASLDFRSSSSSGEKKKQPQPQPPPPPVPTSTRPHVPTNPTISSLQNEDDGRRPKSLPATPRNEGFRYPGSDLAGRKPSLRAQARRYEDDLPVFNNGIGGGPIARYPLMEDDRLPLLPRPPASSRPYGPPPVPPKRPRPEQDSNSRNG